MGGERSSYAVINPCKMCQPLGALFALKGVANTVVLLHGSQGCATYMRRHMTSHFNEPIDVASSSLSESGAVYGGEENLKRGLRNVIAGYRPGLVGVVTTCLAETIGDDVERIVREFVADECERSEAELATQVVTVSTPSYMGSQAEGFNAAVRSLVERFACGPRPRDGRINVIPGNVSPADARYIKEILEAMGVSYTLVPDISDTLDAPMCDSFKPIPDGGATLEDIAAMAGGAATIQCGLSAMGESSAAAFLESAYNVSSLRMSLPIGLANTDRFLKAISGSAGVAIPERYLKERGRLLDAMVDAHKVLFGRRPAIYGDTDLVEALAAWAYEVGMEPAVIATGGGDAGFVDRVTALARSRTKLLCAVDVRGDASKSAPRIMAGIDYEEIERAALDRHADLLIGNSDGAFISRNAGIPLIRVGFPIRDRLGAQRILSIGYEGAMNLVDAVANALIAVEKDVYRKRALKLMEGIAAPPAPNEGGD